MRQIFCAVFGLPGKPGSVKATKPIIRLLSGHEIASTLTTYFLCHFHLHTVLALVLVLCVSVYCLWQWPSSWSSLSVVVVVTSWRVASTYSCALTDCPLCAPQRLWGYEEGIWPQISAGPCRTRPWLYKFGDSRGQGSWTEALLKTELWSQVCQSKVPQVSPMCIDIG